jgi:hypothetical protein
MNCTSEISSARAASERARFIRQHAASVLALAAALLVVALLWSSKAFAQSDASPPAPSSLIVKMIAGLTADQQAAVIARNGGVETSTVPALRLHVVEVGADQLPQALAKYQADVQVARVEVNAVRQSNTVPSDPLYPQQWALPRIGWDLAFGTTNPSANVVVAVLDTGIDGAHPDLAGNVIAGTSMLDGSNGLGDPSGHGTMVAGTVAARTNTTPPEGIAGVGYAGVRLMPVTVLNAEGLGQDSDIINGVVWAVDHGADVILMAFSNPGFSASLQEAIDYAWSSNVVLVAATGNDGVNAPTYPAGDRGVIGVSATDENDRLAPFSNYGASVFLAAPGTSIVTTDAGGSYVTISGTSSSAAMIAGAAAQMMAVDPTLSNGVVVGRLARTADPAGTQDETGNGRVNLARALLDTGMDYVQPAGAAPVGSGGPFVGPYVAAACTLSGVSTVAQSPPSPTPGTTVTYTNITLTKSNGNCSGNWTINWNGGSAPTGVTTTFSPATFTGSGATKTTTLTITTTSATPVGARNFTVTAGGSDTGGSISSSNFTFALVAPPTTMSAVSGSGTYGGTATVTARLTSNGLPVSGKTIAFGINGNSVGTGTTDATGVATVTASLGTTNAGTYPSGVSANFGGDSGFQASSGTGPLTVSQASSTTMVTCPASVTYTGLAQTPCSANVSGAGGLSQSLPVVYGSNVNAGTATASASYAGDSNHTGSNDSKTFTIDPASSTTVVTCPASVTYTGAAQTPCTATVTGVGGLSLTPTPAYANNTAPGTATASHTYAGDANHTGSSDSKNFTIDRANTTTAVASSQNPATADQSVSFTATVTPGAATGTVQFLVGGIAYGSPVALTAGAATIAFTNKTAGSYTVSASYSGDANYSGSGASLSPDQQINPGAPARLAFGVQPTDTQAGQAITPAVTVSVLDAADNLVATDTSTVTMAISAGGAFQAGSTTAVAAAGGIATFANLKPTRAGTFTLSATDGSLAAAQSGSFNVGAGPAVTFSLGVPPTKTAGESFDITVSAKDTFDNTATGYVGVVHFTSSDPHADLPVDTSFAAGDHGVKTIIGQTILKSSGNRTITATDTVASSITGTSPTILVNPGSATVLIVTAPSAIETAGVPFDVMVEAQDAYGNTATGYAGTIRFYITDPKADTPANYTFVPANDAGIQAFSVNLHSAGQWTVKATDTASNFYGVSGTITVQPGPPAKLAFRTQPGNTFVGVAIPDFQVAVLDADDNLVDNDNGNLPITVALGTNPTGVAVLSGTASVDAVHGLATFTALMLNKAASGYTLKATSGTLTDATSAAFDVGKGTATLSLGGLSHTYDGSPKSATVTTSPAGLGGVSVTYNGSPSAPTNAGSYAVIATLDNPDYQATPAIGTLTIDKATSTTVVACPVSVTYNGAAQTPCTVSVTGAGGLNLNPAASYANNTNAGTATASYVYPGDDNHTGSSDSKTFVINKADPIVTATGRTCTYDGTPCAGSGSAKGVNDEELTPVSVAYTVVAAPPRNPGDLLTSAPVNAGTYQVAARFAGNANYNAKQSAPASITINKASSTTVVTCPASVTYNGASQTPCTVSVTGAGGLALAPTPTYADNTNAGTASASYSYTGDANHDGSTDTKTFVINRADPVVTATGKTCTYDGTPCAGGATAYGVNGEPLTPVMVAYATLAAPPRNPGDLLTSAPVDAGTYQVAARFAGNANYNAKQSAPATITINQATSTTVVTCPASVTYSGSAQTPCSASVTGAGGLNLAPTPLYTDNLNAGTATAAYTYAGDINHTGSSDSKTFAINKADPVVTVTGNTCTYDGATPCAGSGSARGVTDEPLAPVNVAYTVVAAPPRHPGDLLATAPVDAGVYQVSARFAGNANYNAKQSAPATITVNQAASTTSITCPAYVTYTGSAQTPCSVSVTGAGGLNLAPAPVYANNTNAGSATASYTYPGDANHAGSSDSRSFTIAKANSATSVTCPASVIYNGAAQTPCTASVSGVGGLGLALTVSYASNIEAGTAAASASYDGDANHLGSSGAATFAIARAATVTTVTVADATYDGATHGATAQVTGPALSQALTVYYTGSNGTSYPTSTTPPANAGQYTAYAAYADTGNYVGSSDARSFTIGKANQAVALGGVPAGANYGSTFTVTATITNSPAGPGSGKAVAFASSGGCINGAAVYTMIVNVATPPCTVTATLDGNANYNAATPVTMNVNPSGGVIVPVHGEVHVVDPGKWGVCGTNPGNGQNHAECKLWPDSALSDGFPEAGDVVVRLYDLKNASLQGQYGKDPGPDRYRDVYASNVGLVGTCTPKRESPTPKANGKLAGFGEALCGAPAATDILVLAGYRDFADPKGKPRANVDVNVVFGKKVDGGSFKSTPTNGKLSGSLSTATVPSGAAILWSDVRDIHAQKTIRKDPKDCIYGGTNMAATTCIIQYADAGKTVYTGSYLEIIYPTFTLWDEGQTRYLYPFIMSSDSEWTLDVCAAVPQGYQIVGVYDADGSLVASADCVQAGVAGETKIVAFEVVDLQSPPPRLTTKLKIKHKGRTVNDQLDIPGKRKGRDK